MDAGTITLKNIKTNNLSFNWAFKKNTGYCNTNGSGNVVGLNLLGSLRTAPYGSLSSLE
ncbi:MAG: hypothetical protein VKI83_08710 [Synechococcaceae cyanobacterium]|nr:hypothetical protein [Synechococcaceae cyanobacterium]